MILSDEGLVLGYKDEFGKFRIHDPSYAILPFSTLCKQKTGFKRQYSCMKRCAHVLLRLATETGRN